MGGCWDLAVNVPRGLQQSGLWALVEAESLLGDCLLWACIWGQSTIGCPIHVHCVIGCAGGARKSKTDQVQSGREASASCYVPPVLLLTNLNVVLGGKEKCFHYHREVLKGDFGAEKP